MAPSAKQSPVCSTTLLSVSSLDLGFVNNGLEPGIEQWCLFHLKRFFHYVDFFSFCVVNNFSPPPTSPVLATTSKIELSNRAIVYGYQFFMICFARLQRSYMSFDLNKLGLRLSTFPEAPNRKKSHRTESFRLHQLLSSALLLTSSNHCFLTHCHRSLCLFRQV